MNNCNTFVLQRKRTFEGGTETGPTCRTSPVTLLASHYEPRLAGATDKVDADIPILTAVSGRSKLIASDPPTGNNWRGVGRSHNAVCLGHPNGVVPSSGRFPKRTVVA